MLMYLFRECKTMKQYREQFLGRSREAATDLGIAWGSQSAYPKRLTPLALTQWFLYKKANLVAPSTFRLYRASISWGIREFFSSHPTATEALALLASAKCPKQKVVSDIPAERTSSDKSKSLTPRRFESLKLAASIRRRLKLGPLSLHFLQATLITGLRPAEWLHAEKLPVDDSRFEFSIRTKTLKQGAGSQENSGTQLPFRTIPVPLFSDTTESAIKSISVCLAYVERFKLRVINADGIEEGIRDQVLTEIWNQQTRKLGRAIRNLSDLSNQNLEAKQRPENTTLYSARHQFKTNVKNSLRNLKIPEQEQEYLIAAIMGHNNTQTQKGYGLSEKELFNESTGVIYASDDLSNQARFLANIVQSTDG